MTLTRLLFCVVLPPLAVIDCGAGAVVLTLVMTCLGWFPGVGMAVLFSMLHGRREARA